MVGLSHATITVYPELDIRRKVRVEKINKEKLCWDIKSLYVIKLLIYSLNNIFIVSVVREAQRSNPFGISAYEPLDTLSTSLISSMTLPEDFGQ